MKRASLQYYQMVLMDQAFYQRDIPITEISWYMHAILPKMYSQDQETGIKQEPLDKETLKKEIIIAGTSAYECLIEACEKSRQRELIKQLTAHTVNQFYRWVWIWSEDNSIMRRGVSWFTSKEECLKEGKRNGPSYTTFDGLGSPSAILSAEAVCPCFVHRIDVTEDVIGPPCLCFTADIPTPFKGVTELDIDGLFIVKTPIVNFSYPPQYRYLIKNTGELFNSNEKDIYKAYLERRRFLIVHSAKWKLDW